MLDRDRAARARGRSSAASSASSASRARQTPSTSSRKYSRSARGMSSASPNSWIRSCQGQSLSCQRYSACSASLRATERCAGGVARRARSASAAVVGHHCQAARRAMRLAISRAVVHGLAALVAGAGGRALECLLHRLDGQHAEDDGHAGLQARKLQAAGALAGDVLEMRRVAADDAAERHDRVEAARLAPACARPRAARTPRARARPADPPAAPPRSSQPPSRP